MFRSRRLPSRAAHQEGLPSHTAQNYLDRRAIARRAGKRFSKFRFQSPTTLRNQAFSNTVYKVRIKCHKVLASPCAMKRIGIEISVLVVAEVPSLLRRSCIAQPDKEV